MFAYHAVLLAGVELADPTPSLPQWSGGAPGPKTTAAYDDAVGKLGFSEDDHIDIARFARRAPGLSLRGTVRRSM
ncbi:hypothetical protein GCM10009574_044010 [Streptomyces asiaticus]|uniref:Uncharacterized protein n=2 Tax=Streptomyces rhizosphaericus TaxID=114699 RepID=A0ABN1S3F3_9ACTN